ncbi:MAG: cell division protein FtsX [Bacteroidia bacterium]
MSQQRKQPLFQSLFNTTLALLFLGIFGLIGIGGHLLLQSAKSSLEYRIILYPSASPESIEDLSKFLQTQPQIQNYDYVTPEKAFDMYQQILGKEVLQETDALNPFPPTFVVHFMPPYVNSSFLLPWTSQILEFEGVNEVDYPIRFLQIIEERTRLFQGISLLVGAVLVLTTYLLVYNTIRLSIFARRLEIRTMELLGATSSYIQRPFLISGILQGFFGGFMACVLLYMLLMAIHQQLPLNELLSSPLLPTFLGGIVLLGTGMGFLGSKFALQKYLYQPLDKIA